MSTLLFILIICAAGYWYIKKRKQNSGDEASLDAAIVTSPAISDQELQALAESKDGSSFSFDELKKLEQTYGPSLREALQMVFGTLILVKGRKLRNGKDTLIDRTIAKTVSAIDRLHVIPAFKGNQSDYSLWWSITLESVAASIKNGWSSSKQKEMFLEILKDYEQTNEFLMSTRISDTTSLMEDLRSMDVEEGEAFTSGPASSREVKFKLRTSKAGIEYYELNGAYKFFNTDVNPDEITAKIELIIASLHWLSIKSPVWRCDIEKYPMPSTTRLDEIKANN